MNQWAGQSSRAMWEQPPWSFKSLRYASKIPRYVSLLYLMAPALFHVCKRRLASDIGWQPSLTRTAACWTLGPKVAVHLRALPCFRWCIFADGEEQVKKQVWGLEFDKLNIFKSDTTIRQWEGVSTFYPLVFQSLDAQIRISYSRQRKLWDLTCFPYQNVNETPITIIPLTEHRRYLEHQNWL